MTSDSAVNDDGPAELLPLEDPLRQRRRQWLEGGVIVAFWSLILMLTLGQRALDPGFGEPGTLAPGEALQAFLKHALWAALTPGIFWLSRRFSLDRVHWPRNLALHLLVAFAVALAVHAFSFMTFRSLVLPEGLARFSFTRSLSSFFFLYEVIVYLVVLSAGFARDYFLRYQQHLSESLRLRTEAVELKAHAAELQAQLAEARLHALRMQLNPHFLFNTLNTVSTYLERDPRGVRRMIARLGQLLRYTLEQTDVKEVSLEQELSFLEGYLEIQRIRFGDRLAVRFEVEEEVRRGLIPNLIVQPLVENALKHGIAEVEEGGWIAVRAFRRGEELIVEVEDNGPGLGGSSVGGNGIGLRNTRERLESLYGGGTWRLWLGAGSEGGVVARLSMPFHTADDLLSPAVSDESFT